MSKPAQKCEKYAIFKQSYTFLKNGPTPASFSVIFGLFKQTLQFLQYVKSVHTVYGAGIRTHDPLICC